jgi:hypothetical protein
MAAMDTSPPLSVVDHFVQIMDGLCAMLIVPLELQSWVGRSWIGILFGAPSRSQVLRFCEDMRELSDMLRVIAAGIAVVPPPTRHSAPEEQGKPERIVAMRRTTRRVPGDATAPVSPRTPVRPAAATQRAAIFEPAQDRVAPAHWPDIPPLCPSLAATPRVVFRDMRHAPFLHAPFVTLS